MKVFKRFCWIDVERSRRFYTGLLGFEVALESPPPGDPAEAETFKDPDGVQLELTAPVNAG